jgi:hypothetical protein
VLASYAKQAQDETLEKLAMRIRGRAVQRCGELLRNFDGRGGDRSKTAHRDNSAPTKQEVAEAAGISLGQLRDITNVGNIPKDEFEALTELDDPPTISALAERGTKGRLTDLGNRDPHRLQSRDPARLGRAGRFMAGRFMAGRFMAGRHDYPDR